MLVYLCALKVVLSKEKKKEKTTQAVKATPHIN